MPRTKYEKPQPGNPHQLAIRQHVIPARSIERFAGADGRVETQLAGMGKTVRRTPEDELFVQRRAWDEKSERGYMKRIEDPFQELVDAILAGRCGDFSEEQAQIISRFYALWYHRSRNEPTNEIETQMNGVTGQDLTKDEQERFEKMGVLFVRPGGTIATRHITGMQLMRKIDGYMMQIGNFKWGIIRTPKGEFVMPDVPSHTLMPISPNVLLCASSPSGEITKANLVEINASLLAYTRNYFFARNIQVALAGIGPKVIQKAVRERDARIASGEV